ncbi:MAG: glycosyltransferase [Verrucomicrobia bacterium]|nr:MAG: glycosyltransferase [Verrucomicrobiota bacterium]
MKIHVWVPDYASAIGGIQTFSRFLVRGLRDVFPDAHISVFSKNDTSYPDARSDPADKFVPSGWWHRYLRTASFAETLFRAAVSERPDFIITSHVNFAPVAHWLQKSVRVPYAAVGHGVEVWEVRSQPVSMALRAANVLLAVSGFTRRRMAAALGIEEERISILPNTFDPEQFYPQPKPHYLLKRYGLKPSQPVILTIARLASAERYKGYDQILRALPILRSQYPNVRYVLGGRGPDKPRVERLIRESGVSDNVILAGYVTDYELRSHYNLCDVFVMPSKGEGFGIVFLEALACAKPVLAGNKDGSVDAVLNGELGALVDPDSVSEIATELQNIINRSQQSGGSEANKQRRARVIEAYGYDRFRAKLEAVLAPLVRTVEARS